MKQGKLQWTNHYKTYTRQVVYYRERLNNEFVLNYLPILYSGSADTITQNILIALLSAIVKVVSVVKMKLVLGLLAPFLQLSVIRHDKQKEEHVIIPHYPLEYCLSALKVFKERVSSRLLNERMFNCFRKRPSIV